MITRLFCFVLLILACSPGRSATFHVAADGNDKNRGSEQKPFASFNRARDAVRKLKHGKALRESVTVIVHQGTYSLNAPLELMDLDSGTSRFPVVWQAAAGEEVRIAGGPALPAAAFSPVRDEKVLVRLNANAGPHVWQLNLRAFGVTNLPEFPVTFRGVPAAPELFFNEERMTLARWPNKGWAHISKIIEQGSVPREGDNSGRPGIFEYADGAPDRWKVDHGVWLQGYWCYDWYDQTIQAKSIDATKKEIVLAAPSLYGVRQGNPSPRRFRALNLLEELDEPGEFYIDRLTGVLYFWPPAPLQSARIALSTLDAPLIVLTNAEHITLRGFTIEATLGNGIEITGGRSNRIESCVVRNTRQLGIRVNGGFEHTIESCDIHDTGTGGMLLDGGDRKTLTPARHEAVNNHIWQFSRHQLTSAYGLVLGGVGNRAAHNVFHHAPHQAIHIAGNDHVFEYNIVSNVVQETDDAGALYKGRNPSCRGNIIRYNLWRDIGNPMGHGTAAIYFDDGDGGDLVFGNIFLRGGHPGHGSFGTIFSHGGHDNRAENNIFIESRRAFGSAPWSDQLWKETVEGGHDCHFTKKLLEEVDITKPPYTNRYPELIGFMTPRPGQPRNNLAGNNVLFRCGEVTSGNWQSPAETTWITETDPGFVDLANGNYALRPDAEIFKRLPGFKPIPFDRIGFNQRRVPVSAR